MIDATIEAILNENDHLKHENDHLREWKKACMEAVDRVHQENSAYRDALRSYVKRYGILSKSVEELL